MQLDLSTEDYPPRSMRAQISHAKNHGITPNEMESQAAQMQDRERQRRGEDFSRVQRNFAEGRGGGFRRSAAEGGRNLRKNPEVRAAWSGRFQYLMVDEFQDTNQAQEELVRLLAGTRKNVCVVGDEDQSIYGWRGARAGNLKRFTEDFPDAKLIRLEENYRSTQTILDAAAAVVKNNTDRLGKNLQATVGAGEKAAIFRGAGFDRRRRSSSAASISTLVPRRSGRANRRAVSHGRAIAVV